LFFLNSCSNEDLDNQDKADFNINQARAYFNQNPIKIKNNIYFLGKLDWEKADFKNDILSIPLVSNKPILIKKLKNAKTSKYLYPFLLITKNKADNSFDYNLKVFISSKINGFNEGIYHLYNMNNNLISNKEKVSNTKKTTNRSVQCEQWGYFETSGGVTELIYTWWVCTNDSRNEEMVPDGGGGGSETAPCSDSATTAISKDSAYTSATSSIMTASADGNEHSITLGRDANGKITQAPMNNGGPNIVTTNTSWPGAFADIHNHSTDGPPSSNDIVYAAVKKNEANNEHTTSFVNVTDGSYAIVVTNLLAAHNFVTAYPADISPIYPPEFPDSIFNQIDDLKPSMGYDVEGRMQAVSFILDKYGAGITILKQDSEGNYKPIKMQETINPDGSKTYIPKPCDN
jgi:hypothetical protein